MLSPALPKLDGSSVQPANEMNGYFRELVNIVQDSGQTLSGGNDDQVQTAVSRYAAGGAYYTCGGSVNAYVLTPLVMAVGYSLFSPKVYFDGMLASFLPSATNTSGTVTVNIDSLGVKDVVLDVTSTPLPVSCLQSSKDVTIRYNESIGKFILVASRGEFLSSTSSGNGYIFLPGGWIMQWGKGINQSARGDQTIVFPIPFRSFVDNIAVSTQVQSTAEANKVYQYSDTGTTLSQFVVFLNDFGSATGVGATPLFKAIGK